MVVDDEPSVRQLLRMVLEESGYEVKEAANGAEAIRVAGTGTDLLITDIVMPDKEGIELIQHFRKSLVHVKVIAISGAAYGHYLHMAQMLGADAVFHKPFDIGNLLKTVSRLLEASER